MQYNKISMSDHPEAFLSNFGNVLAHMVSAECNENDTSLADCVEFDLSSSGSGSGSPNQPDQTIHAGLICEGMQILVDIPSQFIYIIITVSGTSVV